MKKVVSQKIVVCPPEYFDKSKFYAFKSNLGVGILQAERFDDPQYRFVIARDITEKNTWGTEKTAVETLRVRTKQPKTEVYEFDDAKEFYQWLADNV